MESISIGWRSAILLIGAIQGLITIVGLWRVPVNRAMNRFVATLILAFVLWMTPQIIGFAGFYQAFPWLTFMPSNWSLGYGVLIYLYCYCLVHGSPPSYWRWLFVPLLIQIGYYSVLFALPVSTRWDWDDVVHSPYIDPAQELLALAFAVIAIGVSWRRVLRYRTWMQQNVSNGETHDPTWVRHYFIALVFTLAWVLAELLYDRFVDPVSYVEGFYFYVWISIATYWLGYEALRHAALPNPVMPVTLEEVDPQPVDDTSRLEALATRLQSLVEGEKLYRDPDLSLKRLASLVGSNTTTTSAAINRRLGQNFSDFINGYRVNEVREAIAEQGSRTLLDIGLEAGFSSKTSFNRVFKQLTGQTPSAFKTALKGAKS